MLLCLAVCPLYSLTRFRSHIQEKFYWFFFRDSIIGCLKRLNKSTAATTHAFQDIVLDAVRHAPENVVACILNTNILHLRVGF